ncbi:MAG: Asp-tRNA(Asn)/Glu-tRNA(Gln) amidotransferase subunit GatB [Phycisphaerales bacterium]|nr:Asp-tRNA(Asn)/Glu-tRNA(Gln) amidotransferase subunit GatB [Phycisphaerales bacterium]
MTQTPLEIALAAFEPVIGLEVHCQLMTKTKLFCGCSTAFGAEPNHQTCPVCLAMPGSLPVLNTAAVDHAVRFGLAVGSKIESASLFARKQYFYPDLPKGYQISQFDLPICKNGSLEIEGGKVVRLTRAHLEEDAGKSTHGGDASFVDINRAGVPLIEVVSEPAMRSAAEAVDFLRRLRALVRHLGVCDGNMEEGSFRCDANVSLRPRGTEAFGTRCEIKNLNSFKSIERAIEYEIVRQAELLENGAKIVQQTLLFDAGTGRTAPMRSKEESHDYRYFPDPDLPPVVVDRARLERLRKSLPELPAAMARRYKETFGLSDYDAGLLTADKDLAVYFDAVVAAAKDVPAKAAANWIASEFLREANERGWALSEPPVTAKDLARLLQLVQSGAISGKIAKTVFAAMADGDGGPDSIISKQGLAQVSDEGAIAALVDKVLDASPGQVQQYLSGKTQLMGYFVGQAMKESQGKANPAVLNRLLAERLLARKG